MEPGGLRSQPMGKHPPRSLKGQPRDLAVSASLWRRLRRKETLASKTTLGCHQANTPWNYIVRPPKFIHDIHDIVCTACTYSIELHYTRWRSPNENASLPHSEPLHLTPKPQSDPLTDLAVKAFSQKSVPQYWLRAIVWSPVWWHLVLYKNSWNCLTSLSFRALPNFFHLLPTGRGTL